MLVLWLCEILVPLVSLQEMIEEDKEIRAGFPMHHSSLTEITTQGAHIGTFPSHAPLITD